MRNFVLALLLCFGFSLPAAAQQYEYRITDTQSGASFDSGWLPTPGAVNASYWAWRQAVVGVCPASFNGYNWRNVHVRAGEWALGRVERQQYPCSVPTQLGTWNELTVGISRRVYVPPPPCLAGDSSSAEVQIGYLANPVADYCGPGVDCAPPSSLCAPGSAGSSCLMSVTGVSAVEAEDTGTGFSRILATYTGTLTGTTCTPPVDPPPPSCPEGQAAGTVNGQSVCAPTGGGDPGDGDPGDGDPGDGDPGDGDPGDGEPGDGEPGDGEPGDGEPGDGEPGDGEPGDGEPVDGPDDGSPGGCAGTGCGGGNGIGGGDTGGDGEPGDGEPGDGEPVDGEAGEGEEGGYGNVVPLGSLYTEKNKSFTQVLSAHRNALLSTSLGQTVGGFFTVPSTGGSCPTYSADIPYIDATVTIDAFCASWVQTFAPLIRAALLLVAAFFAFRVAFL